MTQRSELLNRLRTLNVFRRGERRAPHKPLLLLIAISELLQGHKLLPYGDVERRLGPLLNAYAPPVEGRHQPALPYWHLQGDGLWVLPNSETFEFQRGGFPKMKHLRASSGKLPDTFADALLTDRGFRDDAVTLLLNTYFPESLHDDILDAVGLSMNRESEVAEEKPQYHGAVRRDPAFRINVLRAYEHRCAVTGFRAALSGTYFGCEAAHIRWRAYDGPDTVDNGIALEPTMHKLLDAGAWSLTDDRRILVSREFTGSEEAERKLRRVHGAPLRMPLPGESLVSIDYIRWHREPTLGGVFRKPALPLDA